MLTLNNYLERKAGVLATRQQEMATDPARAIVRIAAQSHVAGFSGARPVRLGETTWVTDAAPGLGGNALGPSAPEMLLGALASCLVHTYLIVAALEAIPLEGVTLHVQGELDLRGVVGMPVEHLPQIERVTWQATPTTNASPETIAHLHAQVERLCPVLNTLRNPVAVTRTEAHPA
jgi:uncharacterized OsmC-like protein